MSDMDKILVLFLLLLPAASAEGSHSISALLTYHEGKTPFPKLSILSMLDDVTLMYYNGETNTIFYRGNTTNEDTLLNPAEYTSIIDFIYIQWVTVTAYLNNTPGILTFQRLVLCELKDNGEPGQMIIADAFQGSTLDELHWYNGTIKYTSQLETDFEKRVNVPKAVFENVYYPLCIKALKVYLEKRGNQVNRRVKPKVHIIQNLSGSRVMCLATGFYPRHINLTLFRDGQQVSDYDITGGDLLPNDDGTYQMRKILEISEKQQREKHKYTCTATHLSLDKQLDVTFEYDGTLLKPVLSSVLTVVVLMIGIVFAVILCKKLQAASKEGVSSPKVSLLIISLRSQSSDV